MKSELGSIVRVGADRWRVRLDVGRDPVTRERRRLDKTIRGSKADAKRLLSLWIAQYGDDPGTSVTLKDYLESIWLPYMEPPRVRRLTVDGYKGVVKRHIVPYIGALALDEVKPRALDRWLQRLTAAGVEAPTRLHAYRCLNTALNQAVKWRMVPLNALNAVDAPKPQQHEIQVLTAHEAREMLQAFRGHYLEPAVALALGCGLRRSEIMGLDWSDVDLANGTITVRRGRHYAGGEIIEEPPKTPRSFRKVSLAPATIEVLTRYQSDTGPVVYDDQGAPIKPHNIPARFRAACKELGVPYIPMKDLRHSHATIALEAGVDVVVVSRRLGHSTVTTTDRFYLRPGRAADEIAAGLIGEMLDPSRPKTVTQGVKRLHSAEAPQASDLRERKTG